jgi:hypothetical protein
MKKHGLTKPEIIGLMKSARSAMMVICESIGFATGEADRGEWRGRQAIVPS